MKTETAWQGVLAELALQMTQATFDTWLRDSVLLGEEDGTLVVGVKTAYAKDWLENRLLATIKRTLGRLTGGPVDVRFEVRREEEGEEQRKEVKIDRGDLGLSPEVETAPTPRVIDRDVPPECRVSIELINFDPRDEGFVMFSTYGLQFWKPYLGVRETENGSRTIGVAFSLWATLRSCAAHWMTRRRPEWPSIQTLADICANKNRHRVLGRAARGKRRPVVGAVEVLEQENILRILSSGAGCEVIYRFRVLDRLPLLTPRQVEVLTPRLQERHARAIARCRLNIAEWYQLELPTLVDDEGTPMARP